MDTEEFLNRIQERASLGDAAAALHAGRATITTLAEQLTGEEANYLAAFLPPELARLLESVEPANRVPAAPEVFFRRVSEREGVSLEKAKQHARAVLGVMAEAVPTGEEPDAGGTGWSRPSGSRLH